VIALFLKMKPMEKKSNREMNLYSVSWEIAEPRLDQDRIEDLWTDCE
jgi:hypothetical protein